MSGVIFVKRLKGNGRSNQPPTIYKFMQVSVLFLTDEWHSYDSFRIIGVFDNDDNMRKALKENKATEEQIEQTLSDSMQSSSSDEGIEYEFVRQDWIINDFEVR